MDNLWEISGISLQLLAGFLFILKQISDALMGRIAELFKKYLAVLAGDPKKRWKKSLVAGMVFLPLVIAGILIYGVVYGHEAITWSVIGGAAMFVLFGYYFYLSSVAGMSKLLGKWKLVKSDESMGYSHVMVVSQVILFVISLALLFSYIHVHNVFLDSSQNLIWQFFIVLYIFLISLAVFPVSLLSLFFLGVFGMQNFLCLLQGIGSGKFWAGLLVLWCLGGVFLLINACHC